MPLSGAVQSSILASNELLNVLKILLSNITQPSHVTIQILPKYDPKTYKTPIQVDWFSHANYATNRRVKNWERQLSREHHDLLMELLREFLELMSQNEIAYSLAYGTLIGSCRHFDVIPWDTDVVGWL